MTFRSPTLLLLALLLVPLGAALVVRAARRRRAALAELLGGRAEAEARRLRPLARQRLVQGALAVAALALLGAALAGPRLGATAREARQESLDLMVVLDVSESMRAEDVAPSRLERAVLEVTRLVEARPGDRVGLVVFAGEAFVQCPLTTDRSALRLFLDAADPEQLAVQGTDVGRALRLAQQAFEAAADGTRRPRAVLVVSDGEDHEGGAAAAAADLRREGIALLALGIGTEAGAPVPEVRRGQRVGTRRDREGRRVVSAYDPEPLRAVAGRDGVVRIGDGRADANALGAALDRLDRAVVAETRVDARAERFQWPLAAGLLLLLVERLVGVGTRRRARPPGARAVTAYALLLVLGLGLLASCEPGVADGRAANRLLRDSVAVDSLAVAAVRAEARYAEGLAQEGVTDDVAARLWHNVGVARARQGLAAADSAFALALALAPRPAARARMAANAAAASLALGDARRAVGHARRALWLAPGDARAETLYEIARALADALDRPPPEPSPDALRIKAEADALVARRRYADALGVLTDGLARDSTVAAFGEFMQRLGAVVGIEALSPDAAPSAPSPGPLPGTPAPAPPVPAPHRPPPSP